MGWRFVTESSSTTVHWGPYAGRQSTSPSLHAQHKAYVFSDSVLFLGGISDQPVEAWKNKIIWHLETRYLKDLNRIDGEPMDFEWKNIPGFTTFGIFVEIKKVKTELQCKPEQFEGRILFMSVYNDMIRGEQGNHEKCETNSVTVVNCARRFPLGRWSFLGRGSEKKWYGTYSGKPGGNGTKTAERVILNFTGSDHTVFRATSALERG